MYEKESHGFARQANFIIEILTDYFAVFHIKPKFCSPLFAVSPVAFSATSAQSSAVSVRSYQLGKY
jgi:hypothetical protein